MGPEVQFKFCLPSHAPWPRSVPSQYGVLLPTSYKDAILALEIVTFKDGVKTKEPAEKVTAVREVGEGLENYVLESQEGKEQMVNGPESFSKIRSSLANWVRGDLKGGNFSGRAGWAEATLVS